METIETESYLGVKPESFSQPVLEETVTVEEATEKALETTPATAKLTDKQIRQLRREHITVTHGTIVKCGHKAKFDKGDVPRNNCVDCWEAYFMTGVDLEGIHVILTRKGPSELVKQKGKKFLKMFHGFLTGRLLPSLQAMEAQATSEIPIQGSAIDVQEEKTNSDSIGIFNNDISTL